MQRRDFLLSAAFLPLLMNCGNSPSPAVSVKTCTWEVFLEEAERLGALAERGELAGGRLCARMASMLAPVDEKAAVLMEARARYQNRHKNFPEFAPLHHSARYQVTLIEFESGERIPLHDHPDMHGAIRCLSGSVRVANYNCERREGQQVLLKPAASAVTLSAGMLGTLSPKDGNIHELEALSPMACLDLFIPPYSPAIIERCRFYHPSRQLDEGRLLCDVRRHP